MGGPPDKVSDEELKAILADHVEWLETKGNEGTRVHLRKANLEGADLREANRGSFQRQATT